MSARVIVRKDVINGVSREVFSNALWCSVNSM